MDTSDIEWALPLSNDAVLIPKSADGKEFNIYSLAESKSTAIKMSYQFSQVVNEKTDGDIATLVGLVGKSLLALKIDIKTGVKQVILSSKIDKLTFTFLQFLYHLIFKFLLS